MGGNSHADGWHRGALVICVRRRMHKAAELLQLSFVNFLQKLHFRNEFEGYQAEHLVRNQYADVCADVVAAAEQHAADELDAIGHG